MSKILTDKIAEQLFQEFLDHPELTWTHNNTGCESRADLMAELAEERGYAPQKIWIEISPGSEGSFSFYLNKAKTEVAYCSYHVAPVLQVDNGGEVQWLVFDPALFEQAVTQDEWKDRLSTRANEHKLQLKASLSDWRNYYAPVQMIFARDKALEKRSELLALSKDQNDAVVFSGICSLARARWVDELMENDPDSFKCLEDALIHEDFALWFKSNEKNTDIENNLKKRAQYFNLPCERVLEEIDFTDVLAAVELRKLYWQHVFNFHKLLKQRSRALLDNTSMSGSPEDDLAFSFQLWWGDGYEERTQSSQRWYSPYSHELWERYGVGVI